jgi:1-acyl-sn-glycerol-3-phosphate acyltransferase
MDAMIIGYITRQPVYFMAKGTLFNSKLKLWLLKSLKMIPINRQGEGAVKDVSNQSSFEECYQLLEKKQTLVIFPEGTSFLERRLRELKTGTARIALEVEKRNKGKLNVKVVPLGLIYLKAEKFRSSVLINVGKQLEVKDFVEDYKLNAGKAAKQLTERFRLNLENVLINSSNKEQEILVDELAELLSSRYLYKRKKGVEHDVRFYKEIRDKVKDIQLEAPEKIPEIQLLVQNIQWRLRKLDVKADFLDRKFRSFMFVRQLVFSVFFLIVGLPLFMFGTWHNLIQFKITDYIVPKITKDIEYYAPIAVFLGMFLYPLAYFLYFLLMSNLFEMTLIQKVGYIALMPLSGLYAYSFNKYLKHISFKWRYLLLMFSDKEAVVELKIKRNEVRELIFGKETNK